MTPRSATPLFVDTSAFYAHFVENAPRHGEARGVFDGIRTDDLPYRPLVTSSYVLSELATLLLRKTSQTVASDALERIRSSSVVSIVHPNESEFAAVCQSFERFDDQRISFVDHSIAVLARQRGVEHVFAFDDDFRVFDLAVVPADTGDVTGQ
ncbi:type II toxin-antitoxin system VapC family toxin [Halosimplex rubrum]|uniref:Ribonuclease VapC n=1 Tax=Halosimplex rubrum TaxID=869889 RepID=A0A7D5P430_9EURY|nr:PIN domain-containing protein [Halosimplex rubrum]QLH77042.1 type II toxin-antitoxin system VapC family toxin [Halosimplex rubrum]